MVRGHGDHGTGITTDDEGGVDPFTQKVDQTDYLTHGRLKENEDPAAARRGQPAYNDVSTMPGPVRQPRGDQETSPTIRAT